VKVCNTWINWLIIEANRINHSKYKYLWFSYDIYNWYRKVKQPWFTVLIGVQSKAKENFVCPTAEFVTVLLKRCLPLACGPPDFIGTQLYEASRFKCHCDQVAREIQAQSWHFETVCIVCSFYHVFFLFFSFILFYACFFLRDQSIPLLTKIR